DETNALEPFTSHPEMVLKREDIACFVANWTDKAANLREIARRLNIGLDSLVFADDNPAERAIIRRELPMVQVPELPEDPTEYGDNGISGVVAGRRECDAIRLDTWLMSGRVLGRGMEEETLNLVAAEARRLGAKALIGEYRPTAKNGMVREHYAKLGFAKLDE